MRAEPQHKKVQSRVLQPKQSKAPGAYMVDNRPSMQRMPNETGLPDNLKTGVENMSGLSLDDVRVHYNSDKPAQMQAHAYTQGRDIHVAPGQERYLPHETWHAVQQMQGRVQPTMQLQGVNVNNDISLEREADTMGWRAVSGNYNRQPSNLTQTKVGSSNVASQLFSKIDLQGQEYTYTPNGSPVETVWVGHIMEAWLDPENMLVGEESSVNRGHEVIRPQWHAIYCEQMYKGHLLNAMLGGYAVNSNLYPITSKANNDHSNNVENYVKSKIESSEYIHYKVEVLGAPNIDKGSCIFKCQVSKWNRAAGIGNQDYTKGEPLLNCLIWSTPTVNNPPPINNDNNCFQCPPQNCFQHPPQNCFQHPPPFPYENIAGASRRQAAMERNVRDSFFNSTTAAGFICSYWI